MADITLIGAVVDSNSIPWANAEVTAVLVSYASPQGTPKRISDGSRVETVVTSYLDASGNLSITLAANNNIYPSGTQWMLEIKPNASAPAQTIQPKAYNSSADIGTAISAQLLALQLSGSFLRAYDPSEISGSNLGDVYLNTSADTPTLWMWDGTQWVEIAGGGGTPFSITGFSGGSTVEIGASVINPTFSASYSETPNSANITNTDGTDSPLNLTTPFTSGTVVGTFSKNSQASVTFTLHATKGSSTPTANQAINFWPRNFVGVGTAGADGATADGNNADLVDATGTLNDAGLSTDVIGTTFTEQNPSGQKIYVLTTTTVTVWKDAATGFALPFNAPSDITFTNQNGDNIVMKLYETTNTLTGPFTPQAFS